MTSAKPRIAVVLPPREGFGPGRTGALGLIARRLAVTPGFDTTIYGGKQDGPIFPGIPFQSVAPRRFALGNTNVRYAAALASRLKRQPPSLIEVHNRPEIALALAERLRSIPVTILLNNDPQSMRETASAGEREAVLKRLALVMTASDYLRQRFMEGVRHSGCEPVILPNCFDMAELPPAQPREKLILFAGRVVADKGPDAFVAACAEALPALNGWTAVVIGADRFSDSSPETNFVQTVRRAAAAAGVSMFGYRDHPAVLQAMARASIVVMPSRWPEPFGLVAVEAMASGAALIASPRGALAEVCGEAALFADPDDIPAMAAAIRLLGADENRRHAIAEAGRIRAQLFSASVIAPRLAELRHRVVADWRGESSR